MDQYMEQHRTWTCGTITFQLIKYQCRFVTLLGISYRHWVPFLCFRHKNRRFSFRKRLLMFDFKWDANLSLLGGGPVSTDPPLNSSVLLISYCCGWVYILKPCLIQTLKDAYGTLKVNITQTYGQFFSISLGFFRKFIDYLITIIVNNWDNEEIMKKNHYSQLTFVAIITA